MLLICEITNLPTNIVKYWNMANPFVRQRNASIEKNYAMTTKKLAETSDYMNIFHREITTMLLPREKHKSWTPTEGRNKHIDSFFFTF